MCYEDMAEWNRKHDLLLNRCAIINQIHGCAYDWCSGNPCTVSYRRGWYTCYYFGRELVAWGVYDLDSARAAYGRLDALADALWLVSAAGVLRRVAA